MVWLFGGTCRSAARLDGKVAVVTGSNTGIGKETAQDLAARGALVVMAVRDTAKGEIAAADIRRQLAKQGAGKGPAGDVRVEALDLASLRSVRECARRILEEVKDVHILVNNAGIMACPKAYTEDGHDMQFGVNHLGHFLLTVLLLPRMRASTADSGQPARIVNVSSVAYSFYKIDFDDLRIEKNYKPLLAYARSKLANMLFTRELARRFKDSGVDHVNSYCLHPGVVATELFRTFDYFIFPGIPFLIHHIGRFFIKTPRQGAQTSIYCAVHEKTAKESGLYYVDCSSTTPFAIGRDDEAALRLWDVSLELVGLKGYDPVTAAEAPAWAFQEPRTAAAPAPKAAL
ncbi:hypothetical protein ONE63_010353 [Megalurothrips usitatus]|uniref:Retinol dehydrogenase 12-like n=1 Tax=Megalurothrips usitatus TaxID=439358 RepID=A0AAV7XPI2_9NEOP|nr:hypothetical protein ONE63_010353 [Megalurothrips usitatus]